MMQKVKTTWITGRSHETTNVRAGKKRWCTVSLLGRCRKVQIRNIRETGLESRIWKYKPRLSYVSTAQEEALRGKCVKANRQINRISLVPTSREKGETVNHVVCDCPKLAHKEYKRRHDKVAKIIHWKLCAKYNLERKDRWCDHEPERVLETDFVRCSNAVWPHNRGKTARHCSDW